MRARPRGDQPWHARIGGNLWGCSTKDCRRSFQIRQLVAAEQQSDRTTDTGHPLDEALPFKGQDHRVNRLENGERDAVVEYFELCRKFWKMDTGRLDQWSQEAKAGKIRDFGANLVY